MKLDFTHTQMRAELTISKLHLAYTLTKESTCSYLPPLQTQPKMPKICPISPYLASYLELHNYLP